MRTRCALRDRKHNREEQETVTLATAAMDPTGISAWTPDQLSDYLVRSLPPDLREACKARIISNHVTSPPWFQACADAAGLYELASDPSLVVVSQEVEAAKPDRRIYDIFFERLLRLEPRAEPSGLVFVDDKEKNVAAAVALGWQGLTFNATKAGPGELATALAGLGFGATVSGE